MLARFAVNRPVTILMATLAVATFGLLAALRLPVDLLPDLSYPTLTIQTSYPDAAPISVEQFVTRPVEEAVGVIPGVRDMRSISRAGLSEVTLEFEWKESMELAALEVRERLGLVELPVDAEIPRVLRYDPSLEPIMRLALTSEERPLDELRQLGDRWLKPRLETIAGVAAAKVRGGFDPEIVVEVDENRLATLGLSHEELAAALRSENVNQPGGTVRDFNAIYLVRTMHEFVDPEQIRRTVVRQNEKGMVRVEDVARVYRGHRDRDEVTRLQGAEVVEIDLHRQGLANTISVSRAASERIAEIRREMADDLSLVVLSDQSSYISAAIREVWSAAWLGGLLAILVLYFFLRDLRATTIIAMTIPISLLATFLAMQQVGVTLNIMSLGGLALGIGMLVDNSIVVLEAIDRRRNQGLARSEAAVRGTGEVTGAVAAATLTTVSVFLPIVFVEGVAGQLFQDQAITVCLSLLTSLVVSLTVIPALSGVQLRSILRLGEERPAAERRPGTIGVGSYQLDPIGDGRSLWSRIVTWLLLPVRMLVLLLMMLLGGLVRLLTRLFNLVAAPGGSAVEAIGHRYPGALRRALRLRWAVLVVALVLFGLSVAIVPTLGTNLVPDLSQGQFGFQLRLPEGTALEGTTDTVARIEQMLADEPYFERIFSIAGSLPSVASGRRTVGENLAQLNFTLADADNARLEAGAVARVRQVLAQFPRVEAELMRPAVLTLRPPIALQLFSNDLDRLQQAAEAVRARLEQLASLKDVATTAEPGSPEIVVALDRERASALGVSAEHIGTALRTKIHGDVVGEFREGEERIDIRLRAAAPFRSIASEVEALRILLPGGVSVPVSAVADVVVDRGPAAIYRIDGARVAEVDAIAGADLGSALRDVRSAVAGLSLPQGVRVELEGQNEELRVSFNSLWLALGLATFLVYVVMASQFESLVHPLVILIAVPLGIIGVVGALLVTANTISVLVLIGAVILAGIVVNNAIVLVDAINRRRREGADLEQAIVEAGGERLRPILMTTATTVLALLPMAIGLGAGDELRAPLAVTVIGGLAVATALTLVVTPCLYRVMATAPVRQKPEDAS